MVSRSWWVIPNPAEPVPKMTYRCSDSLDWVTPTAGMIHAGVTAPVLWLAVWKTLSFGSRTGEERSQNSHIIVKHSVDIPVVTEQLRRVRNAKMFQVQRGVGQVLVHELNGHLAVN